MIEESDLLGLLDEVNLSYTDEDAVLDEVYSTANEPVDAHDLADKLSALPMHADRLDTERVSVDVDSENESVTLRHYRNMDEVGRIGPLFLLLSSSLRYVSDQSPETARDMLDALEEEVAAASED